MPAASLEVSKTLQYDVLGSPSAAVSISKTLNYDVLKPIASAVNVSKFIQYVVVSSGAGTLCVADLYFSPSGQFFDLTDPNNRGVFHSPTGGANWLGGQASIPLSAPVGACVQSPKVRVSLVETMVSDHAGALATA